LGRYEFAPICCRSGFWNGAGATNALDKSDRWWLLGACRIASRRLQVWSFLLLAGGIGYRLTTKDFPAGGEPGHAGLFCERAGAAGGNIAVLPASGFVAK